MKIMENLLHKKIMKKIREEIQMKEKNVLRKKKENQRKLNRKKIYM